MPAPIINHSLDERPTASSSSTHKHHYEKKGKATSDTMSADQLRDMLKLVKTRRTGAMAAESLDQSEAEALLRQQVGAADHPPMKDTFNMRMSTPSLKPAELQKRSAAMLRATLPPLMSSQPTPPVGPPRNQKVFSTNIWTPDRSRPLTSPLLEQIHFSDKKLPIDARSLSRRESLNVLSGSRSLPSLANR